MKILADALTWVMKGCYSICGNYGSAILLFTLFSKILLLPVSIWVQKNSIKMVRMQPEINYMKAEYFGDRDTIAEKQAEIFKRERYNPLASVIPMLIQLVLLMGVIEAVKAGIADSSISRDFFGIDLGMVPSRERGLMALSPVIAGVSAWLLGIAQNAANVLQAEQTKGNKYAVLAFSVGLSLYLGWFVPVGVALYWTAGNLLAIAMLYLLNMAIDPRKYIDYEKLNDSKEKLAQLEGIGGQRHRTAGNVLSKREKTDYKRFFSVVNKHIAFYAEGKGFYKYYRGIVEYLLEHTNLTIHYITSDPEDAVFARSKEQGRLRAYYIGEKRLITLMMKLDVDVMVMTMPDLGNFHIKRSYVRDDIEYVYIPHGMDSLNLTMRTGSMNHYDTVLCVGKHQKEEIEKTEAAYGLQPKRLVEWGYGLLDDMKAEYGAFAKKTGKVTVLIAPSWQPENIVDTCLAEILDSLKKTGYHIIVRPHPQHVKHKKEFMASLAERYKDVGNIEIQTDFSSDSTVFGADILLTDWSGIAYEYAYTTEKPVLFINTPMKVMNPEYQRIDTVPLNILLRDEIGCSLDVDEVSRVPEKIRELLDRQDAYKDRIHSFVEEYVYHIGSSAEVGAGYLIESIQEKIKHRRK